MDAALSAGGEQCPRLPAGGDPCLRKGLLAALFLSLSFLLGEFVFANMLVGTRYETLQVYLYSMRATSGHFTQRPGDELLPADPAAHLGSQQISSVNQHVPSRSESAAQILR